MSKKISLPNNENILKDAPRPMTPELNGELYYSCSECSSLIEIISINEEKNTIEFNCLNPENKHQKNINIPIKEYIKQMKKFINKNLFNNQCDIHKKDYISYCFECNLHLCKDCLKARIHLNHKKNNLIEIQPLKEELNIIEEVINYYETKIENLILEKKNKIKKLNDLLNKNKIDENKRIKEILIKNEIRKEKELKRNNDEYKKDIDEIIKKYKKEINIRKKKYINDKNKINNKYKLIDEKENIIHTYKINELTNKINAKIKNLKYDKQIEEINNIKRLNEIILNTYNICNNNYFNAININSILHYYMNNDYIKNKLMKNILSDKYDEISKIIEQKDKNEKKVFVKKKKLIWKMEIN